MTDLEQLRTWALEEVIEKARMAARLGVELKNLQEACKFAAELEALRKVQEG